MEAGSVPVMHTMAAHELRTAILLLRILVLIMAIISVALLATAKETSSVPLPLFGLPQPLYITRTAKYELVKGLRYFFGVLLVVICYMFIHLLFNVKTLLTSRSIVGPRLLAWTSFVADSAAAYLLVSGASVATEIGYLAERGATPVMWNRVCTYFSYFCKVYGISVLAAFLAAIAAFFVVAISGYHLFRLYGIQQQQQLENVKQAPVSSL